MSSNWATKGTSSSNPNHKKAFNSNLNGAKLGKDTRGMAKTTFKSVRNNGDEDDEALCLPTKDSLMASDTNNTEAQVVANSWDTWDSHVDTSKVTQEPKKPEEIVGGQMIFTVNNSRVKDIEKDNTVYEPEEEEQGLNLLEAVEKETSKTSKKNDKKAAEISKPDDTREEGQNSRGAYNERGGYKDNANSYGRNQYDNGRNYNDNGRNYNNNNNNNNRSNNNNNSDNGKAPYSERGVKGRPNESGRTQYQDSKREFNEKGRKYDNNNYQQNNYFYNNNQRDNKNASYNNAQEEERNPQDKETKQQSQRFYDKNNQESNNDGGNNNQRENGKNQNKSDYQRKDINSNSISSTTSKEQETGVPAAGSSGNDDRVMFSVNKNRVIYEEPEPKYSNIQVFCQPPQQKQQQPQQYVQYPPREQNKYEEEKQEQVQNQQYKPAVKRDSQQQNQESRQNPQGDDQIGKNGKQQHYYNNNNNNSNNPSSTRQKPNNNNNARNFNDSGEQEDGNFQPKYQQRNTKKPRKQEVIYVPKNKE